MNFLFIQEFYAKALVINKTEVRNKLIIYTKKPEIYS